MKYITTREQIVDNCNIKCSCEVTEAKISQTH